MGRESADQYRSAFESLDEGFCIIQLFFDADHQVRDCVFLEVNASFERQMAIEGAKGKRLREIAPAHAEAWSVMLGQIAGTGQSQRFHYAAPERRYEGYAYRIGSTKDTIAMLFHDVTDEQRRQKESADIHKTLEHHLIMSTQELAKTQEQLHAMTNELTLAEQRERKRLATELQEDLAERLVVARLKLGQIRQQAMLDAPSEELLKEVDKLLTRSLVYTRTLVADLSPLVLQDLGLPSAVKWLAERMHQHGLAVTVQSTIPDEFAMPEAHLVFLFQSVRELLMNTLKHAKCRGASVIMTLPPGCVQVEVQDDGVGFGSEPTDSPARPSKFGLFSIRERIHALAGSFDIDSRPEEGTKATLKLPLGAVAIPPANHLAHDEGQGSSQNTGGIRGEIIRVLLVDDHAMVRQGLRSVLDAYPDMKVVGEAADGEAAVKLTTELLPTVVLMDINMPVCNGVKATQRIKSQYPDIKVIGLSVNADGQNQEAMLQAGAYALMTKEAAVEQLYTLIYQAVNPGVLPFSPLR